MPLTDVSIKGMFNGSIAKLDVQMSYVNANTDSPLECTFEFPITDKSAMTRLRALIGDKIVEAAIKEKEEAKEKYDDAIAAGNTAILAEESEKKHNAITLKLGNLLPGQTAVLTLSLTEEVEIVGGSYCYNLPGSFFPDFQKHTTKTR